MGDNNFKEVADAALAMAEVLLPQWLGGKRQGNEWIGESKANGGAGNSWCVNLTTGAWGHFSGNELGGDLVSLYAARNHVTQSAARKEVAQLTGVTNRPLKVLPSRTKRTEGPPEPIPLGAPEPIADREWGLPADIHRYGDAFWVLRYEKEGGAKSFRPLTWRNGTWSKTGYPEPRPLYNLSGLAAEASARVLIVEGEKSADAAAKIMGAYVVMTWAHGAQSVSKNDWSPLAGRDVLIWPDADEPGAKAAAQVAQELIKVGAARVRVITVDDHSGGWDAADAVQEGWDSKHFVAWAAPRIKQTFPVEDQPAPAAAVQLPAVSAAAAPTEIVIEPGDTDDSAVVNWRVLGLDTNEGGAPHATIANVSTIIRAHPRLQGHLWYDSFTHHVMTTLDSAGPRRWTDADDLNLTVFIQQSLKLNKIKPEMVAAGVMHAARVAARNSLTDYLDSLKWDGVPRLTTWLQDTLGCEHNDYSMAIARNWPIAMVARAYRPGCKVDNMPVLEGTSGLSKTTFLEVLGAQWYKSLPMAFGDKDFLQAIQGAWLVEIPDMTGFSRRDHTQILATITIRNDTYRASYGRHVEDHPRTAMFAATSETDDYLQDARGRRRYWPIRCTDIDIDILHQQRDQVFAEAREEYRNGARWYEMPGSADTEQTLRAAPDLWTDKVLDYVNERHNQQRFSQVPMYITSSRILSDAIELPIAKQTDIEKRRIARILRENGWVQRRDANTRHWRKVVRSSTESS